MILKFLTNFGQYQPGAEYSIIFQDDEHIIFDTPDGSDIIRVQDGKILRPDTTEEVAVVNLPSV